MGRNPAYVNLVGSWLLSFMFVSGKFAGLTEISFWWCVSPVIAFNVVVASITAIRRLLGASREDSEN